MDEARVESVIAEMTKSWNEVIVPRFREILGKATDVEALNPADRQLFAFCEKEKKAITAQTEFSRWLSDMNALKGISWEVLGNLAGATARAVKGWAKGTSFPMISSFELVASRLSIATGVDVAEVKRMLIDGKCERRGM